MTELAEIGKKVTIAGGVVALGSMIACADHRHLGSLLQHHHHPLPPASAHIRQEQTEVAYRLKKAEKIWVTQYPDLHGHMPKVVLRGF